MLETIILPITYHHMDYFENKQTASESGWGTCFEWELEYLVETGLS